MKAEKCPILEAYKVQFDDPSYGEDKNWAKRVCENCVLKECFYDRDGMTQERIKRELEGIIKEEVSRLKIAENMLEVLNESKSPEDN